MDDTADTGTLGALNQKLTFLNESPAAWFIFIGMIALILWVWGSIIHYLTGET